MTTKTKQKASAPVAANDSAPKAVSANLLADIANKELPKKGKNKTPVVHLPEKLEKKLNNLLKAQDRKKELEAYITEKKAECFPTIEEARIKSCRDEQSFHGSVNVNGIATFITNSRYSGTPVENEGEMVGAVMGALREMGEEATAERAAVLLNERTEKKMVVTIDDDILLRPEIQKLLIEKVGAEHLKVKYTITPTDKFHQDASLDEREQKIMDALKQTRLIKGTEPYVRRYVTKDEKNDA